MSAGPSWREEGRDWPNRETSRFVAAGGLTWHVQGAGDGPVLLLLHGTGAASHSWRDLAPLLARNFTVVAPDLPGHGFTEAPDPELLSLPAMARAVGALLRALGLTPALAVGHSAGAAILIRMALDKAIAPAAIVSLNGALLPFRGVAGRFFPSMAKLLVLNPFVPRFFAWRAGDPAAVERLLEGTGSRLDARGLDLYGRLFASRGHVAATLAMMANWDLDRLQRDLPRLETPLVLVAAERDRAVQPADADRVARLAPHARVEHFAGAGHLAHEEKPREMATLIRDIARSEGVLAAGV